MTKTELKEFLMNLKREAVQKVREEMDKKENELVLEYIKKNNLEPEIKSIGENLKRVKFEFDKLNAKVTIPIYEWNNIFDKIEDELIRVCDPLEFIKKNYKQQFIEGYGELEKLNRKSQEEVKKAYDTVIGNVTALKNIKQALAYVRELGFDVPEEEKRQADLMVPVDTRFLIKKGGK